MSSTTEAAAEDICALCGNTAGDDIKLKNCTACKLVKYCGVECQRNHRSQHKETCKKRAAELHDELLFKQPEGTHLGDCPICFLPLPVDAFRFRGAAYHPCCSKMICIGCIYASKDQSLEQICPFCRTPYPDSDGEANAHLKKRAAANDPFSIRCKASECYIEDDYVESLKLFLKAASLGDIQSHHEAGFMYMDGEGAEVNMKKGEYHLEVAAIGGNAESRYALGMYERNHGSYERAMKHLIIAAKQGLEDALAKLKDGYVEGKISKDEFGEALRAYQRAVDAAKSPQREEAGRNIESLNIRAPNME